jgi:hypothetical protein
MFEVSCFPMLAVFSTMLENYSEPDVVAACIRGIRRGLHIAGLYVFSLLVLLMLVSLLLLLLLFTLLSSQTTTHVHALADLSIAVL